MKINNLEDVKILVVDDNEDIRELLAIILKRQGYDVIVVADGVEMDVIIAKNKIDLIVLDAMMPGEDGLSICKRLQLTPSPPIIMLSAKGEDIDRIRGLKLGAEDYMAKPFNPDELIARIKVVLRRSTIVQSQLSEVTIERFLGWSLNNNTRKLTSPDGLTHSLSSAEYAVLRVFLNHPDRPLKRDFILSQMAELHEHSTARALDTLISRLRRKLSRIHPNAVEDDELIRTVYGIGYMLKP